jgi:hypothetical protein
MKKLVGAAFLAGLLAGAALPAVAQSPDEFQREMLALLEKAAIEGAPVAARAAICGHWSGGYWQAKIIRSEVRLNGDGSIGERFATEFNKSLDDRSGTAWSVGCDAIYVVAVDSLVLLDSFGEY